MKLALETRVDLPEANRHSPQAFWQVRLVGFLVLLLTMIIPLVSHGCHGDDIDHEPSAWVSNHDTPTVSNSP